MVKKDVILVNEVERPWELLAGGAGAHVGQSVVELVAGLVVVAVVFLVWGGGTIEVVFLV